jgi:predicted membrane-bound dolichyl-phosphate-mannose-protein mannosyltransferase
MISSVRWGRIAAQAVVAGVAGAILIDAFLWAMTVLPQHGSMLDVWLWIASTAFGKAALANPAFAWVGLAMHVGVSVGWAGGYAYLAATRPFLSQRWLISGFVYGLVVYLLMQIVLLVDGNFVLPAGPSAVAIVLAAHCIFFGIPVAYTVRLMDARAA